MEQTIFNRLNYKKFVITWGFVFIIHFFTVILLRELWGYEIIRKFSTLMEFTEEGMGIFWIKTFFTQIVLSFGICFLACLADVKRVFPDGLVLGIIIGLILAPPTTGISLYNPYFKDVRVQFFFMQFLAGVLDGLAVVKFYSR